MQSIISNLLLDFLIHVKALKLVYIQICFIYFMDFLNSRNSLSHVLNAVELNQFASTCIYKLHSSNILI